MATSPIYELLPAFKERNRVIFMLLGLLSLSQDWCDMLETQVSNKQLSATERFFESMGEPPLDETERGFLYFLLGTVSFSHNLQLTLENACQSGEAARQPPRSLPAWEDTRGLLR